MTAGITLSIRTAANRTRRGVSSPDQVESADLKPYIVERGRRNIAAYEWRIRSRAEERAAQSNKFVGEGYAERQIANTLKLVGKIEV